MTIENKKYIMIVDDNDLVRDILEQYVIMFGYEPIVCNHTKIAKETFLTRRTKELPLDLILMDIKMPNNDPSPTGIELGKELVLNYNFTKIVYISTYATEITTQKEVHKLGAICISKPFFKDELKKAIKYFL